VAIWRVAARDRGEQRAVGERAGEGARARARTPLGIGYGEHGRHRAEVLVDTVTYIVCSSIGLDTAGSSIVYIAGWGEHRQLDAIEDYAETIDTIARRIEEVL